MKDNYDILINRFAQGLEHFDNIYSSLSTIDDKKAFLKRSLFLMSQLKPNVDDLIIVKSNSKIRRRSTALVLLEKELRENTYDKLRKLPPTELENTLRIVLELFKTAHSRQMSLYKKSGRSDKWWFNDLSDPNYLDTVKFLTSIPVDIFSCTDSEVTVSILEVPLNNVKMNQELISAVSARLENYFYNFYINNEQFELFEKQTKNKYSLVAIQTKSDINAMQFIEDNKYLIRNLFLNEKLIGTIVTLIHTSSLENLSATDRENYYSIISNFLSKEQYEEIYKSTYKDMISAVKIDPTYLTNSKKTTLSI